MEIKVVAGDTAQIEADAILVNLKEIGHMVKGATWIGVGTLVELALNEAKNREGI